MAKVNIIARTVSGDRPTRVIKSIDNVFGNFLLNEGLYSEIEITKENIFELADLVGGHVKINCFCPKCKDSRVFSCEVTPYYWYDERNHEIQEQSLEENLVSWQHIQDMDMPGQANPSSKPWTWANPSIEDDMRVIVFKFFCAMDNTHRLDYTVLTTGNKFKKIGQYPSIADLSFPELKEYRKVMSKADEKELKRAIGLYASGIGIGSFVYLRRIFERIIMAAGQTAIKENEISEDDFNKARINEKIKMLAKYLPRSLVESPVFYGIVSKGIHELSEEECLEFFPVMKTFIIMILRQWETLRKDAEEEKNIAASISRIAEKLK